MPDSPNRTPIQAAWITFVAALRSLVSPQPDDRPLDQYLALRDRVIALIESEAFVNGLAFPARAAPDADLGQADEALLMELTSFARSVEVALVVQEDEAERQKSVRRELGRAGTVVGSLKDLLGNLPPLVKSGLTLVKELVDLFKG